MVAVLAALLFTAAFAVSIWAMFVTIEPRLGYMRALLKGEVVPDLTPAVAARGRGLTRSAVARMSAARSVRAAA